ncbi:MAG: YggT family protein [Chlamydiales bacterium]|nr:YggT family protein [Chlamydiales bacterium]
MLYQIVQGLFFIYTLMLLARIIASWVPQAHQYRFMHFLMFYTDPFLNMFRKIIPPIGGMLDLSPILAFLSLRFLEKLVLYLMVSLGL